MFAGKICEGDCIETRRYRTNQYIRVPEVRLIDETGKQVGIVPIAKALEMARDAEQDLVEISPQAKPPVCKIIDFSKFRYELSKKEKDVKNLSQSYVLPRRLIQKNYNEMNNKNNVFNRGTNYALKEPIVDIKIENLKLLYDKYEIPIETGIIYFNNNYSFFLIFVFFFFNIFKMGK